MKEKIRNAYLYAYYECYLQTHIYYKAHNNKNFYSIITLGGVLLFLLEFPMLMLIDKTIGVPPKIYFYPFLIGLAYFQLLLTSKFIGDDDLTEKINTFYANKNVVKESRRIALGFVIFCVLFWVFVIRYDGY
ncbi:hypothetical protein C1631_021385 [Chryseobacterium phosphatilyticum]|uniref:Uncharacterized protein n=1 Tax=Chryseobacterium phosphatilyticum TaxID=475075 RepID=A0A316WQU6_9FLAO|nr:hypothetical protein [Chryseobacterium phosphatilyticum]PWN63539.1 hypothetical protein C1631_021385 [Chryseobacterium phosphatilyticum]